MMAGGSEDGLCYYLAVTAVSSRFCQDRQLLQASVAVIDQLSGNREYGNY